MPNIVAKGTIIVVIASSIPPTSSGEFIEVCPLDKHEHPVGPFTHWIFERPADVTEEEFEKQVLAVVAEKTEG